MPISPPITLAASSTFTPPLEEDAPLGMEEDVTLGTEGDVPLGMEDDISLGVEDGKLLSFDFSDPFRLVLSLLVTVGPEGASDGKRDELAVRDADNC